jgi:hypothetical protein
MKQVQLEDEHPSQFSQAPFVPNAAALFSGPSSESSPTQAAPVGRGKLFAAAAVVALVAGGAGAFVMRLSPASETLPSAVPLQTAPSSASSPAPAKALVKLEISAEPEAAELVLDGAKLEGNPFSGQFAEDAALHRLEVRAPGRLREARMVRLDRDLTLHIVLAPSPAAPLPAASADAATPVVAKSAARREGAVGPSPSGDDFVHKQRDKAARPIDNSDPYAAEHP